MELISLVLATTMSLPLKEEHIIDLSELNDTPYLKETLELVLEPIEELMNITGLKYNRLDKSVEKQISKNTYLRIKPGKHSVYLSISTYLK